MDGGSAIIALQRRLFLARTRAMGYMADVRAGSHPPSVMTQVVDTEVTEQLAAELDLDECISRPCQNSGKCVDMQGVGGKYRCACIEPEGRESRDYFRGDNCEIHVLRDTLWAYDWLMETSFLVGVSLVAIPLLSAAWQVYQFGKVKYDEYGNHMVCHQLVDCPSLSL